MKITKIILLTMLISFGLNIKAQVAITNDGSSPDGSVMLDVKSTDKGMLVPRMTQSQIAIIVNPADGLLVFNTDDNHHYFYDAGAGEWKEIAIGTGTIMLPWVCGDALIDSRDGKSYSTVQIGTQCWMAENLNIGNRIDGITDQSNNSVIEKYCYDDNNSNCDIYGGLYQWDEMMQYTTVPGVQGICANGWHLPTDDEWKTMEMALGMSQSEADLEGYRGTDEGEKMKSTSGWNNNGNGTNSSSFNALSGGYYLGSGLFYSHGDSGFWWSSTEGVGAIEWHRRLFQGYDQVNRSSSYDASGFSVRCLKN